MLTLNLKKQEEPEHQSHILSKAKFSVLLEDILDFCLALFPPSNTFFKHREGAYAC